MVLKLFSLANLADMDGGRAGEAFAQAVQRLQWDLDERPHVKAARTLTMRLTFKPIPGESGRLEGFDVDFSFEERLPKRQSYPYRMKPGDKGPVFSDMSPDNPDQLTIEDAVSASSKRRTSDAE